MSDDRYRILFVCTGNICRSPFAERLLRARLDERFGVAANRIEVASSGTWGLVGEPMMGESAQTLVQYGGNPDGFTARALSPEQVESADLVLALTREHRSRVVMMSPRASGRTLTVREYARLLSDASADDLRDAGGDLVERFRMLTSLALSRRGYLALGEPDEDDIPDPFGGKMSGYERAAALIDASLAVPLALLAS